MFSDVSSKLEGYEVGMITFMGAMIKVKKHIHLSPRYAKKEDFVDWKLNEFLKLPSEHQREELISEQKKVVFSLNLNNKSWI